MSAPAKMTADAFAAAVRSVPLSPHQSVAIEELLAAPVTAQLPRELMKRELLTEYQVRQIMGGQVSALMIGRYVVLEEIGSGGMGQVFKARDTVMDRIVALKVIRPERVASPAAVARFQQEVKAAARLAHPNIVRAYDASSADGRHFLVTEFVQGHDLARELERRGALPPGEACDYARQAAVGLQHAFEQRLTHRDIKPANLLFSTPDKLVKVTDFGLARFASPGAVSALTADGVVMGTPDYMAPEQANSAAHADIRSDLYSLGCTLYEFLTGHVPFPVAGLMDKLRAHQTEEPESLEDACPGINPALAAVVAKLMAKNPADRYRTPLEAVDAIIPFCPRVRSASGERVRPATTTAMPSGTAPATRPKPSVVIPPTTVENARVPAETLPLSLDPDPVPAAPFSPHPPQPRSQRGLLIGGGVAVLVVVLVLALRGPSIKIDNNPVVNVQVPVTVTVKLDDWVKAREPGVVIYLNGPGVSAADREKARTVAEFAQPLSLPPGRYTLVAKKDGKELETKAFDVTPENADKVVSARSVAVPDPNGPVGEVRNWGAFGNVLQITPLSDGQSFVTAECSGPEATLTHYGGPDFKTSTRRYAMNRGEVLNEWSGVAAYNVAVFPEQEFALDYSAGLGGSGGHISYSFRMLDFRAGTIQILDFPDGAGLLYANRLYLMRASADGTRFLRSWAHITNSAVNNGPHGSITVHSVTVTKDRTVKDKEIGRYAGNTACFDPTGKRILTGKDKTLSLWNEDTGVAVGKFSFPGEGSVLCVAVSPNGEFFAAGTDKNEVHIWSKADQKLIATAKGHTDKVNGVDFTQDSKRVVSASQDSSVRVWNAADGTEAGKFKHEGPVYSLAITPGGKRLLSGGQDKRIRLWQLPE